MTSAMATRPSARARRERSERALGTVAAATVGLLSATWIAPWLARRVTAGVGVDELAKTVAYDRALGAAQFVVYAATLALAAATTAIFLALRGAPFARRPVVAGGPRAATVVVAGLALLLAMLAGLGAVGCVLVAAPPAMIVIGALEARLARSPARPSSVEMPSGLRYLPGAFAAWGAWLTTVAHGRALAALVALVALAVVITVERAVDERFDPIASAPLAALPLLGLLRAPSVAWVVAALGCHALLRVTRRGRPLPAGAGAIGAVAIAPFVWLAIVPMRLRELPTANHFQHEAHHFAWVNSALHGKWLMADAATIYPPLREYLLTGWALVTGPTLEHVRIGFALIDVVAAVLGVVLVARLVRGRLALVAWGAYLLLAFTPLRPLAQYRDSISLGWADLMRPMLALLATVVAIEAIVAGRAQKAIVGGALAAAATLYSHEFGLCALGSIGLATLLDASLRDRGRRPLRARLTTAARGGLGFAVGFVVPLAAVIGVYAAFGKATLLLHTFFDFLLLLAAGVQQGLPFPLPKSWILAPWQWPRLVGGGRAIEWLLPGAVYVVATATLLRAAFARRWGARQTMRLALLLLGATSFRVALQRADVFHLLLAGAPAVFVALELAADVLARAAPSGRALVIVAALGSVAIGESHGLYARRLGATLAGDEVPSSGAPYVHPGIPRAGDVRLPDETERVVTEIRARTGPGEAIFCRVGFMEGAELYLLADRRNPTRFDALAELVTFEHRRALLEELRADPPALVIGADRAFVGEEAARWLDDRPNLPLAAAAAR